MKNIKGYHCTSKSAWKEIKRKGLKGSQWDEARFPEMNSNPFFLKRDGAVWCYPSLEIARENADENEVILKIEGQGVEVTHFAHGLCFVGKANLCTATLVKKNA